MESPVRICLGVALVVNLLLLSSTPANGNALPHETTSTTVKDERTPRHPRNSSWVKPRTPDIASNELNAKEAQSEENTDKNAKYKDRGRIRFGAHLKSSTEGPYRRTRPRSSSTTQAANEAATLVIVTPTAEVKRPAQIINSMRNYKKTKMPVVVSTTPSLPVSERNVVKSQEIEDEEYDNDDEDDKESFEKFTSSKFETNFFTIPSYGEDHDFGHDSLGADNKVKSEYSKKPYDSFSSYFPDVNYGKDDQHDEPFKTDSFFNFDTELTTPKNDFFDKKYEQISKSIIKNLDSMKTNAEPTNATIFKLEKQRADLEKLGELKDSKIIDKPGNKSTVFIKNTKEIRVLDNEGAGTANKALSDNVQGTSIYYEMSVLSTETYNISHSNEDDCDNDALPAEPTVSTSSEQELASFKATQPTLTATNAYEPGNEFVSTSFSNYLPFSSLDPTFFSSVSPHPYSTHNSLSPTDKIKVYTSSFTRNRNYSKRLNLTGVNDSPNSVTRTVAPTSVNNFRLSTRKFHYTTPKTKPIWMAPRRNVTRTSYTRSTVPSTIYSEHFSIKDRTTSAKPVQPHRTSLTTVSSEIDPVIEGDVGNVKKIVHSSSISDNSIPTLWKRGSTKFTASTVASSEADSGISDLEIPPTLTAWALASLRSPPSMASPAVNATVSTQKSVDENELQKVGEILEKKETTTVLPTIATAAGTINNDVLPKKWTEVDKTKLPWKPVPAPTVPGSEITSSESKSERLPAESNISIKSTVEPVYSTEKKSENTDSNNSGSTSDKEWVSATDLDTTTTQEVKETIPPVDATKSTGFESITKLPAGMTTPQDETVISLSTEPTNESVSTIASTTDFDITTIRFSYKPTEPDEEKETEKIPASTWHPVFPTRTRATTNKATTVSTTTLKETTINDEPVTTYRPVYKTTSNEDEESSTMTTETTVMLEVSSEGQTVQGIVNEASESSKAATTETSTAGKTSTSTNTVSADTTTIPTEVPTMVTEIVTEINTDKEMPNATSTEISMSTEVSSASEMMETSPDVIRDKDSSSEQNSGSNEVITQETRIPSLPTTTSKEISEMTTESEQTTADVTKTGRTETKEPSSTQNAKITDFTTKGMDEASTDGMSSNDLDSSTTFGGEVTTEAIILTDEAGSGAAIAIAVSTIGVIALILLVGLLLVVRRRGRRGVYAQRCTPVSLDAYSLDSVSVGQRKGNHRLRASKRSYGNPAYDDEVTSHPMQYAALANFALDIESMTTEFAEIPSVTVRPDEVPPGCEEKNRYSNVLPLPDTRVPLRRVGTDPTSEYINANFITGPGNIKNYYIACQAPLPNTVDDFWRMMWEQNSRLIVMLTEYMENGVEKCYEYLPPSEVSDNKRTFGDYQIILTKREQHDKYAVSTVQLVNLNTRTWREISHLWYFWPAKGVPDDYESVIDFLSEMRSYMKISQTAKEYDEEGVEVIYGDASRSSYHNLSKLRSDDSSSGNGVNVYSPARAEEQLRRTNGTLGRMKTAAEVEGVRPCVVMCASGAGRSAAIIAADICARALAAAAADVPRVVRELRAQRPHSLSNRHHYIFLYKLLAEYGNKLMGGGVDTI